MIRRIRGWIVGAIALWGVWNAACFSWYEGRTPLMEASLMGLAPAVRLLVFMGAQVNEQATGAWNGRTPLALAAQEGHLATARVLLDAGAETNWGGWRNVPLPPEKGGNPLPEELRATVSAAPR